MGVDPLLLGDVDALLDLVAQRMNILFALIGVAPATDRLVDEIGDRDGGAEGDVDGLVVGGRGVLDLLEGLLVSLLDGLSGSVLVLAGPLVINPFCGLVEFLLQISSFGKSSAPNVCLCKPNVCTGYTGS